MSVQSTESKLSLGYLRRLPMNMDRVGVKSNYDTACNLLMSLPIKRLFTHYVEI
jgi:hypothetical protein